MRIKKKYVGNNKKATTIHGVVNLTFDQDPMDGVSDETIKEMVDEVNEEVPSQYKMTTGDLRKIIDYGTEIRRIALDRNLDPRHVLSVTLNVASEIIAECFAEEEHPRVCTEVFHQFWERCGLKKELLEGDNGTVN